MKSLMHRTKNIVYLFLLFFTNRIVSYIPCWTLRKFWLTRIMGMKIGRKSKIDMGCYFLGVKGISIGKNTHINQGCILDGRNHKVSEIMGGGIVIGNSVSISHRVCLMTGSHDIASCDFAFKGGKILVGDYAFIGINATVLHSVEIGKGAVICAGAVVTKKVEDYTIYAGVPAKRIGERNSCVDYICKPDRWFM